MRAERLYEKVMLEAERDFEKHWRQERLEIVQRNTRQPETKSQQCRKQLSQLRLQTAEVERELDLRKEVEAESQRNLEARMKLREANLTPTERKEREEETLRGRILFSKIIPELSPSWREEATLAFRNKKL
jgi:hypothetical protein